mmetsp:Transcript_10050/g.22916  ORF Transcript_10050/g.22916 Transcript_10050/m.22916 type:complete len:103 (-) Transcript_10050:92-400(-)
MVRWNRKGSLRSVTFVHESSEMRSGFHCRILILSPVAEMHFVKYVSFASLLLDFDERQCLNLARCSSCWMCSSYFRRFIFRSSGTYRILQDMQMQNLERTPK